MIAVFDLDGTLLRGNSFHLWLRYLVVTRRDLPAKMRLYVATVAAMRLTRLISHRSLKQKVMAVARTDDDVCRDFVMSELAPRLSGACMAELRRCQALGINVVLATAAPAVYVRQLARHLGLRDLVASTLDAEGTLDEVFRQRKADAVLELAGSEKISAVFSDHMDDLPLFRLAERRVVVNPVRDQLELLNRALRGECEIVRD